MAELTHSDRSTAARRMASCDGVLSRLMAAFVALADDDRAGAVALLDDVQRMLARGWTPTTARGLARDIRALIERLETTMEEVGRDG